jgi:hypothetical protein
VYAWTLRTHTYDNAGTLHVSKALQCGATVQTACGVGVVNDFGEDIPPESYSQFVTNQVWGTGSMLSNEFVAGDGLSPSGVTMSLPNVVPGSPFLAPQTVALLGISLSNPFGAWPAARANVTGGGGSVTNGATWANHDASADPDGAPGVTSYVVPPGGIGDNNSIPDAPIDYPSSACTSDPYNYLPAPEITSFIPPVVSVRRIKRLFTASRATTQLTGAVSASSCDVITGTVGGPGGTPRFDAAVQGCVRVTSGSGETACNSAILDFLEDSAGSPPTVTSSTFRLERIDVSGAANDNAACEMVRDTLCFSPGACN